MSDQTIRCPKCGTKIELTEALTGQIEDAIKAKYEEESLTKEKEIQAKLKDIQRQQKDLAAKQQTIDDQVAEKLKAERKGIAELERKKIIAEQAEQTKALK